MKISIQTLFFLLATACGDSSACGLDWCTDGVCVRRASGIECRDRCEEHDDCPDGELCKQYDPKPTIKACLPE